MEFTVSIPATSANMGPGYDIWGLALNMRNHFHVIYHEDMQKSHGCSVKFNIGDLPGSRAKENASARLNNPTDNLICQSYYKILQYKKLEPLPVHIQAKVNIPLARGLGSSSTAILGGMVIANEIMSKVYGHRFSMDEIFQFASDQEGHPDNIAAALFGGWINSIKKDDYYHWIQIPMKAPVKLIGVIPHQEFTTAEAREVVPESLKMSEVTFHTSRTCALSYLLSKPEWTSKDLEIFKISMDDKIHQNQRSAFIPGMNETFEYWKESGSYGVYLSGAGTTMLGFWPQNTDPQKIDVGKIFRERNIEVTEFVPTIDHEGLILEL